MKLGRRGTIKPIPLRCGCVIAELSIFFCDEARRLWDAAEAWNMIARQAESAVPAKAYNDAFQAYKSHFKKEQ